jgi:hypothetical protein
MVLFSLFISGLSAAAGYFREYLPFALVLGRFFASQNAAQIFKLSFGMR